MSFYDEQKYGLLLNKKFAEILIPWTEKTKDLKKKIREALKIAREFYIRGAENIAVGIVKETPERNSMLENIINEEIEGVEEKIKEENIKSFEINKNLQLALYSAMGAGILGTIGSSLNLNNAPAYAVLGLLGGGVAYFFKQVYDSMKNESLEKTLEAYKNVKVIKSGESFKLSKRPEIEAQMNLFDLAAIYSFAGGLASPLYFNRVNWKVLIPLMAWPLIYTGIMQKRRNKNKKY